MATFEWLTSFPNWLRERYWPIFLKPTLKDSWVCFFHILAFPISLLLIGAQFIHLFCEILFRVCYTITNKKVNK